MAYLLGLEEELIARNLVQAALLDNLIVQRNFKASAEGRQLMQSLLETLELTSPFPQGFASDYAYFLLGEKVSEILDFKAQSPNALVTLNRIANWLEIDPGNREFSQKVKTGVRELAGKMYPMPEESHFKAS